jgi:hypothetical protein
MFDKVEEAYDLHSQMDLKVYFTLQQQQQQTHT